MHLKYRIHIKSHEKSASWYPKAGTLKILNRTVPGGIGEGFDIAGSV